MISNCIKIKRKNNLINNHNSNLIYNISNKNKTRPITRIIKILFDEISLLDKEAFYSGLSMENITDIDHRHPDKVFKKFMSKYLGNYHYLHVQSVTLLFSDIFENLINKCVEIHELDPAHFYLNQSWHGKHVGMTSMANRSKIRIFN